MMPPQHCRSNSPRLEPRRRPLPGALTSFCFEPLQQSPDRNTCVCCKRPVVLRCAKDAQFVTRSSLFRFCRPGVSYFHSNVGRENQGDEKSDNRVTHWVPSFTRLHEQLHHISCVQTQDVRTTNRHTSYTVWFGDGFL